MLIVMAWKSIKAGWRHCLWLVLTQLTFSTFGQSDPLITGKILSALDKSALVAAHIFWLDTEVGTYSLDDGTFSIEVHPSVNRLVVTYIGFQSDTVLVSQNYLEIALHPGNQLEDVEVTQRQRAINYSLVDAGKIEHISEKELLKAPCCNLSESFETNPSVDVAFTDAITGTRQIQMLGLAGPYIQMTRENLPYGRGLASTYGLTFIPGPWVQSMQLSKGTGSVINGFESMSGQINVELRKPDTDPRLYVNLFANEAARFEGNLTTNLALGKGWSSGMLLHGKSNQRRLDRNEDGFLDNPLSNQVIAMNRYKYVGENGLRFQFGFSGVLVDQTGGEFAFDPDEDQTINHWGLQSDIDRLSSWLKLGKVSQEVPWRSWAVQLSGARHSQSNVFGQRMYDAKQASLYANLLYQSILGNTDHQVVMGLSWQFDEFDEVFDGQGFTRTESVPGTFIEYSFGGHDRLTWVWGLRADHHNQFGVFVTPRFHLRYLLNDALVWRLSLGRGQRTANILLEQAGSMASSRQLIIHSDGGKKPYGLDAEVSWNFGTNFVQTIVLGPRSGTLSVDLYHTRFQNQIVIDLDQNPQEVHFYNLEGRSYAHSMQLQVDYELVRHLDARLAYRWYDVKTTYRDRLLERPLTSRHRIFLNLAYETESAWYFDATVNYQGSKRIPNTTSNPDEYRLPTRSPGYVVVNTQFRKNWNDAFDIYLGAENIMNYRQPNPILASDNPFGAYFDSSLTWGPVFGRNVYLGVNYKF